MVKVELSDILRRSARDSPCGHAAGHGGALAAAAVSFAVCIGGTQPHSRTLALARSAAIA